jgi:hypothetical protein
MSDPKLPRDAALRLAEVAAEYRAAFEEVQALLERADLGPIPGWVFALDRLAIDELSGMGEALHEAELRRRQWKVALHAMAELVALEGGEAPEVPRAGAPADDANLPRLDRFISVVNYARAGGCMYVNGRFQPVGRRAPEPDDKDTFDFPDRKTTGPGGIEGA